MFAREHPQAARHRGSARVADLDRPALRPVPVPQGGQRGRADRAGRAPLPRRRAAREAERDRLRLGWVHGPRCPSRSAGAVDSGSAAGPEVPPPTTAGSGPDPRHHGTRLAPAPRLTGPWNITMFESALEQGQKTRLRRHLERAACSRQRGKARLGPKSAPAQALRPRSEHGDVPDAAGAKSRSGSTPRLCVHAVHPVSVNPALRARSSGRRSAQ